MMHRIWDNASYIFFLVTNYAVLLEWLSNTSQKDGPRITED